MGDERDPAVSGLEATAALPPSHATLDTLPAMPAKVSPVSSASPESLAATVAPGSDSASGTTRPVIRGPAQGEALDPGDTLGRYVVLSRLGAGGMGEVYAAFDPELDRRIALKVIRTFAGRAPAPEVVASARTRLVAEAQALAKLAHPNVVAVYDVGTVGEDVYIAMEYVAGITLTAWRTGERTWREIVEAFVAAGRGLEAAHAAGIVHRDIKPDNIIVGKDGRVRLLDFGVALAGRRDDDTSSLVGTPAYMAPEQFLGGELGPHTDQFSFGVALFEALWGVRPFPGRSVLEVSDAVCAGKIRDVDDGDVPAWLRAAVLRALEVRPADRHASMAAMLAALTPAPPAPPARRRWPWVAALGGTAIAASLIAVTAKNAARIEPCTGFEDELTAVWGPARKRDVARMLEPGNRDSWRAVERVFDDYAAAWVEHKVAACRATQVVGDQTEETLRARNACLDARRRELDATVTVIGAGGAPLRHAIEMATGMHSIAHCDNLTALGRGAPPAGANPDEIRAIQDDVAMLNALRSGAAYAKARTVADALAVRAERAGWTSVVSHALVERGLVESLEGDPGRARETLFEALRRGDEADDPRRQAEAWIGLVGVEASGMSQPTEAMRWSRHAETALAKAGGDAEMQGQLLHNTATALLRLERHADALDHEQQARALLERALGERHYRIALQRSAIATAYRRLGKIDQAIAEGRAALALAEQVLGANHPALATTLDSLALSLDEAERFGEARALLDRALALRRAELGPGHRSVATTLVHLAALDRHAGDFATSDRRLQEAYDIRVGALGLAHPDVTRTLYHKLLDRAGRGLDGEALDLARDIVVRLLTQLDAVELASALGVQCELQRRTGFHEAAEQSCADAVAALGTDPEPARALYVHVYAARAALDLGDVAAARTHVASARAAYPRVAQSRRMAAAFISWAAAHVAAIDLQLDVAYREAVAARDAFASFGRQRIFYLADLEATFGLN
ncbi:MAG: serine/threonine protein kinase [Deltaproteobacteria bacterium]|nr:serine/threonine protein kinase [Deltaproteobacteria bacterium]MCW5803329.1 serine/threonine protein kinase [Deltaproteobacteria bacterium]